MMETVAMIAWSVVGVMACLVFLGYAVGKYRRWRGDDVEVDNAADALVAAQNKRMDVTESLQSDGEDSS